MPLDAYAYGIRGEILLRASSGETVFSADYHWMDDGIVIHFKRGDEDFQISWDAAYAETLEDLDALITALTQLRDEPKRYPEVSYTMRGTDEH